MKQWGQGLVMNRLIAATIAVVALASGGATAADLEFKAPRENERCGGGPFQGIYLGIHGGGVNYTANRSDQDAFLTGGDFASTVTTVVNSGVIGGQAGYNYQCRNAVFGIEVDGSWTQASGKFRLFPNFGPPESTVTSQLDGVITARARAGVVAADSLLVYVTGGIAAVHTNTTWSVVFPGVGPGNSDIVSFKEWNWGWVAGFGAEWAFSERISVRSEVLYVGLANRDLTATSLFAGGPVTFTHSDSIWIARVGANIRLTKD
jgi:outer membrane immunogenic protein